MSIAKQTRPNPNKRDSTPVNQPIVVTGSKRNARSKIRADLKEIRSDLAETKELIKKIEHKLGIKTRLKNGGGDIKNLVSTLSENQNRPTWIFNYVDANSCSMVEIEDTDNVNFQGNWAFDVVIPKVIAERIFTVDDLGEIAFPLISKFIDKFRDLSVLKIGGDQ